jgi:hypothetical protein
LVVAFEFALMDRCNRAHVDGTSIRELRAFSQNSRALNNRDESTPGELRAQAIARHFVI